MSQRNSGYREKVCTIRGGQDMDPFNMDNNLFDSGFARAQVPQIQYLMDRDSFGRRVFQEEEFLEKNFDQMSIEERASNQSKVSNRGFQLFNRSSNFQPISQKQSIDFRPMSYQPEYRQSLEVSFRPSADKEMEVERVSNRKSIIVQKSDRPSEEGLEIVLEWQDQEVNQQEAIDELYHKLTLEKQEPVRDRLSILPPRQGCICKKTQCLKFYCQCFQGGRLCTDACECVDCCNNEVEQLKQKKEPIGCNCKKSRCLKKYCECFVQGQKCGDQCKCEGCMNIDEPKEQLIREPYQFEEHNNKRVQMYHVEF